jgi:gephyrin
MKPGKPSTFATIPRKGGGCCAFFGLPGNPVSCLVTKGLLIDPALKRMQGMESDVCMHPEIRVCLNQNLKLDPERPEYHRWVGR